MYAKLQNGILRSAPRTVTWRNCIVCNPGPDRLTELGYKPVRYTDMPENTETGKHYESSWEETETEITQVWNLVDDPVYPEPEPTAEERISNLETTTGELKSASDDIILMLADFIGGEE